MLHDPQAAAGGRGVIAVAGQLKIVIRRPPKVKIP
jgi:hypothetical protein